MAISIGGLECPLCLNSIDVRMWNMGNICVVTIRMGNLEIRRSPRSLRLGLELDEGCA